MVRAAFETAMGCVLVGVMVVRGWLGHRKRSGEDGDGVGGGGGYWQWRKQTAFGSAGEHEEPSRRELVHGAFEYARWVYRMRRMM